MIKFFKVNQFVKNIENANLLYSYEHLNINKNFRNYIYQIFVEYSVWKTKKKSEFCEKKIKCVERMFFMNFKLSEIFHLRLLLNHVKKIISFEKLRIVDVQIENVVDEVFERQIMNTFKIVCIYFDFTNNDDEWHAFITKIT